MGMRCVDLFRRPDGTFGYEEFRRDPEDQGVVDAGALRLRLELCEPRGCPRSGHERRSRGCREAEPCSGAGQRDELRGTRGQTVAARGRHRHAAGRACSQRRRGRPARGRDRPCVLKAQVPTGKRGKAGGIKLAADAAEAQSRRIRHPRHEHRRASRREAAGRSAGADRARDVCSRAERSRVQGPAAAVLGARRHGHRGDRGRRIPTTLLRLPVDIRTGARRRRRWSARCRADLPCDRGELVDALLRLYAVYADNDAELVEINPLVVTKDGELVALDCKLTIDDSAFPRREALAEAGTPRKADRAGDARHGSGPQVHRARRQRGRARQWRGPHHDDHGRGAPLRRQPGQLHGDRRRELHQGQRRRSSWCSPTRASNACWSTSAARSRAPT